MKSLIFLLTIVVSSSLMPAHADMVLLSAATKCDKAHGTFQLVPAASTTSPEHDLTVPEGFIELKTREGQHVMCKIGNTKVRLVISKYDPGAGFGQGSGVLMIDALSINGRNVFKGRSNFFWQVSNESVLTKIVVKSVGSQFATTYCYSDGFDWDGPTHISNMKCQKSPEEE